MSPEVNRLPKKNKFYTWGDFELPSAQIAGEAFFKETYTVSKLGRFHNISCLRLLIVIPKYIELVSIQV